MNFINDILLDISSQKHILLIFIFSIGLVSYLVMRFIILKSMFHFFKRTSTQLDDILIESGFLNRISYAIPILIIRDLIANLIGDYELLNRLLLSLILIIIISSVNALLTIISKVYNKTKYSNRINIKSYFQILRLILNLLGLIIVISILIGQSPFYLLSGIGALTAVLMLVFKDTILSFVSSIQITSNDLFKIGDWVEAPQFGADGDVIDIALHTVKIQNWDKTISIIPTHKLIDSSFKNWRGMSDSGGRRIKRSIYIDMNSIHFCTENELNEFKSISAISEYINQKTIDIDVHNKNINNDNIINGRALTNIGTFREYVKSYLRENSNIHSGMTFLVRQLSPTEKGLPIEVYVFSNNTNWIDYEGIQSDIFDHLIASLAQFNLKVYQYPSSIDFKNN